MDVQRWKKAANGCLFSYRTKMVRSESTNNRMVSHRGTKAQRESRKDGKAPRGAKSGTTATQGTRRATEKYFAQREECRTRNKDE